MKVLRDELDLRRKTEIHEVEERKNGQINTLMRRHEEAFTDIKNYYNDITLNNLALINSLKVLTWDGPVDTLCLFSLWAADSSCHCPLVPTPLSVNALDRAPLLPLIEILSNVTYLHP